LYIGKSISLRTRVMSHFQSALTVRKEMKLSQQVHQIEWIETAGELSALILEAKLIKERMPSMNIKLRKSKDLCAWQLRQETSGLHKAPVWPYAGAVAIKDGDSLLVINQWCYVGTANDHDELEDLAHSKDFEFDLDIYKIVRKAVTQTHTSCLVKLGVH
jgi:hypothetical protein